jgi:hypothetical protein
MMFFWEQLTKVELSKIKTDYESIGNYEETSLSTLAKEIYEFLLVL